MYVCMYVCMCMCVGLCTCAHVCMGGYICMCVRMFIFMHVHACIYTCTDRWWRFSGNINYLASRRNERIQIGTLHVYLMVL